MSEKITRRGWRWAPVPEGVIKSKRLDAVDTRLYALLLCLAFESGEIDIPVEEIGEMIGLSDRHTKRSISKLVAERWVSRRRRPNQPSITTVYESQAECEAARTGHGRPNRTGHGRPDRPTADRPQVARPIPIKKEEEEEDAPPISPEVGLKAFEQVFLEIRKPNTTDKTYLAECVPFGLEKFKAAVAVAKQYGGRSAAYVLEVLRNDAAAAAAMPAATPASPSTAPRAARKSQAQVLAELAEEYARNGE